MAHVPLPRSPTRHTLSTASTMTPDTTWARNDAGQIAGIGVVVEIVRKRANPDTPYRALDHDIECIAIAADELCVMATSVVRVHGQQRHGGWNCCRRRKSGWFQLGDWCPRSRSSWNRVDRLNGGGRSPSSATRLAKRTDLNFPIGSVECSLPAPVLRSTQSSSRISRWPTPLRVSPTATCEPIPPPPIRAICAAW